MLETLEVQCPYCGQSFEALIDTSIDAQAYIEDCEVCCRPINFEVNFDLEGRMRIETRHENDA